MSGATEQKHRKPLIAGNTNASPPTHVFRVFHSSHGLAPVDRRTMSTQMRIVPRDLFNLAHFLKAVNASYAQAQRTHGTISAKKRQAHPAASRPYADISRGTTE